MADTVMNETAAPVYRNRSAEIDKLATALSKAQGAMEGAKRDAENPGFKRDGKNATYADLASVWDAIREPLSTNGLSVVQLPAVLEGGVEIETLMLHESGQYIRNVLWMPCGQTMTPHTIGSAITYGRRYGLMALCGIAPEDDDGNAAAGVNGDHKSGVPGTAGGGKHFRPDGPRRMPTNNWVDDAQRDGIVDTTRAKGTLPAKPGNTNGPAAQSAIKRVEWCKKAIEIFKEAQTKDNLTQWWRAEAERLAVVEDAMPAEYERLLAAYDAAIERTAARGAA